MQPTACLLREQDAWAGTDMVWYGQANNTELIKGMGGSDASSFHTTHSDAQSMTNAAQDDESQKEDGPWTSKPRFARIIYFCADRNLIMWARGQGQPPTMVCV